jgi:hypothetical protein
MRSVAFTIFVSIISVGFVANAQPTRPVDDAWPLYEQAAARVREGDALGLSSPAASSLEYADYPPFPQKWHEMAKRAYEFNAPALALLRKARSMHVARWPVPPKDDPGAGVTYLNECRNLANEVADAVLYQHVQGNDAEAIECIRDELHLAELLEPEARSEQRLLRALVAAGVRASALNRLEVICTGVVFTTDPADHQRLQIEVARGLIKALFTNEDPADRFNDLLNREDDPGFNAASKDRFRLTLRRVQMERNLASMSLACHVFQFERSRWPASLDELKTYLPDAPTDAWGAMGYALIKAGRPNGSDRPLVYSRCAARDGFLYRIDEPQYGYYSDDGSGRPRAQQTQGGQFRDVTLWAPTGPRNGATTHSLE